MMLTPEQERVYDAALRWAREAGAGEVLTIGGYAGTGKTTLVGALAAALASNGARIAFCAMTGRAASVLRNKLVEAGFDFHQGGHQCSTVHGLAFIPVEDKETGEVMGWRDKEEVPFDIIVLDEASMVTDKVFESLQRYGLPIIAVGDHGQLPPVMSSFSLMEAPELRLETIHRQAEGSPIIQLSKLIREGHDIEPWHADGEAVVWVDKMRWQEVLRETYGQRPWVRGPAPTGGSTPDAWSRSPDIRSLFHDSVVLCHTNKVRTKFNEESRKSYFEEAPGPDPVEGELVVCLKNILTEGVYNGFRGQLGAVDVREHHVIADAHFPSEGQVLRDARISRHQFGRPKTFARWDELHEFGLSPRHWDRVGHLFDFGYTMTVHKAQGSQWQKVVVCKEKKPFGMSRSGYARWLYTAVTRASERLVILG